MALITPLKSLRVGKPHNLFALAFLTILATGCTALKQCAYEGFSRDEWQRPDKVIESLRIRPGAIIADLGSGSGYFTLRLAKAAGPTGKVYAVDIDSAINEALKERAKREGADTVVVVSAKPNDARLPEPVDLIFTSNTYHHIDNRIAYFAALIEHLRPSGRLAVIDYDRTAWLEGLWGHYTPKEFIKRELEQAGYELQNDFDFLEQQSFLIFAPKSANETSPGHSQRQALKSYVDARSQRSSLKSSLTAATPLTFESLIRDYHREFAF